MNDEGLDECRERLHEITDASLEARADALEFVHRSLVAELEDLRDGDHRT